MEESEEELKSLLMKVKEEHEKAGLKLNIRKKQNKTFKKLRSWHLVFMANEDGETMETVTDFIF